MDDYHQIVTETAKLVGVLDENGGLLELDSLMVADLATALEKRLGLRIPMARLTEENFASIPTIAQLLSDLRATPKASA